jgi:hypothetical protein
VSRRCMQVFMLGFLPMVCFLDFLCVLLFVCIQGFSFLRFRSASLLCLVIVNGHVFF